MLKTSNYELKKPEGTDPVDVQDFNDNFDIIDSELKKRLTASGNASETTNTFSQASSRTNLVSGESLKTSLGKIMKWFADLANGAASTLLGSNLTASKALISNSSGKVVASNVTSTELEYLSGATSNVQDQIDELNTDVGNKCFFTAGTCEKTLIKGSSIRCDCLTVPDDGVYLFLGGIDFSESADAIMVSQFCVNGATAYIGFRQNASGGGGDANFMVRQAVKGQLVGFLITSTASSTTIKARCSIYAIRLS